MSAPPGTTSAVVGAGDRLAMTLFVAAAVHAMVVLGVTFDWEPSARDTPTTLDVTLVHTRSDEAPEEADFLAQADQKGGGETEKAQRPKAPVAGPSPQPREGAAPAPTPAASAPPRESEPQSTVTSERSPERAPSEPQPRPETRQPSSEELISRSMEIARLTAELEREREHYAKRPRHTYVSARTRKHVLASYMEAWVEKVERIGNLNYPQAASRRGLTGQLLLDVALNPDGSVRSVELARPSGHKVLDDAAERIVRLAAPFSPFPDEVRDQTDVLHIVRTWRFSEGGLRSP